MAVGDVMMVAVMDQSLIVPSKDVDKSENKPLSSSPSCPNPGPCPSPGPKHIKDVTRSV